MDLIVLRHGQSVADIEERMEGRADYPLTDLGRIQAFKAAKWISEKWNPDVIITSPLSRTVECAQIVAETVQTKVIHDDDLLDWNHGVLAGMLRSEAFIKYPEVPGGRKPHEAIEGGESDISLRSRAEIFMSKMLYSEIYKDKTVVIITHTMMINKLFESFIGLPMNSKIRFHGKDTGIHHWREREGYKYILLTNSMEHLNT